MITMVDNFKTLRDNTINKIGGSLAVIVTDECKLLNWNADDRITIFTLDDGILIIKKDDKL